MNDLAAVILAGGKSSRMGRDKATLPYGNRRLVDAVADAARAAGIAGVYVSGEIEGYASIPDMTAARGPVGGICSCFARLSGRHARLLFIPVDMPRITPELVRLLALQPAGRACHFAGHPLPCILPVDRKTLRYAAAAAQGLANNDDLSVRSFLAGLGASAIQAHESLRDALANANTPEEWRMAAHEYTHQ